MQEVWEVLEVLDRTNLQLIADKCKKACTKTKWWAFDFSGEGIAPVNIKVQGIIERLRPNSMRELISFLGAVNQLIKYVPD